MKRKEVLISVKANVENKNLVRHMLATEAIMRAFIPLPYKGRGKIL